MKKYAIKMEISRWVAKRNYIVGMTYRNDEWCILHNEDIAQAKLYDTKEEAEQEIQNLKDYGYENEFKIEEITLTWRHNSGDNEETDDSYLWINKKPTNNLVSQASGIYYYYIDGKERGMADTLKDAKEEILETLGY